MTTLNAPEAPVLEGQDALPDFTTEAYKDAYSRINAIVIEGEQEPTTTTFHWEHSSPSRPKSSSGWHGWR